MAAPSSLRAVGSAPWRTSRCAAWIHSLAKVKCLCGTIRRASVHTARARAVCTEARRIVPHKHFTFAKLWIHAAHLEVRQGALPTARKLLGAAIGRCPKEKLFKEYAEMQPRCSRDVAEM